MFHLMDIVSDRSRAYVYGKIPFQSELKISEDVMSKEFELAKSKKSMCSLSLDDELKFFMYAGDNENIITIQLVGEFYKHEYETFNEFSRKAFLIWEITLQKNFDKWCEARCTCPAFFKEYTCKHIVAVASRLGIITEPVVERAKQPLHPKKKRGRPSKAKPASMRQ